MSESEMEILCIGNALVDVFARDVENLHLRYGITEPVQHVEMEKLESVLSALGAPLAAQIMVSGGGAANVAKIAGFLGAKTAFTGAIGNGAAPDYFGRLFEKDLTAAGVNLTLRLKPFPTGICLVLKTSDGKTRIAASPSAAQKLSEEDINEDDIKNAALVLIDGFMLDRPALVRHILRMADTYGKTAALDLSSTTIAREQAAEIAEYAGQYPLFLFMNEGEATAYLEGLGLPDETPFHSFFQPLTEGKKWPVIVVKLGSRGATCFAGGKIYKNETKPLVPAETTGAGDAFCAGFLTAWMRDRPVSACGDMGNKAAALVLGAEGSQTKSSDPEEPLL